MILSIFFFTGMSFKKKPLLYKNIMFLMIFFSITIPLSLSISNYGISVRHKSNILSIYHIYMVQIFVIFL